MLLSLRHIYHSKQKIADMHVLRMCQLLTKSNWSSE